MGKTVREKLKEFPPERQKKIRERSAELISEELTRQQLRQLFKITQEQMGQILRINQSAKAFYLPQRPGLRVSLLDECVAARGGGLKIIAVFPDDKLVKKISISKEPPLLKQ
jgi:polyhydroxyalkanoate synthesis regulator protein